MLYGWSESTVSLRDSALYPNYTTEPQCASRDSISDVNVADDHQVSHATGVTEPITPLTTDLSDSSDPHL